MKNEFSYNKVAFVSLCFLLLIVLASLFAFLSPFDPDAIDMSNTLHSPTLAHWFGTDELGRDYFTRALYGGRISLTVGILAMLISSMVGVAVGTISGFFGGWVDNVLMRIVDVISSIPWIVLVTVITIYLKPGITAIIIVIGFFSWMSVARLVRAETLTLKEREYVLYSISCGQSNFKIITKHIILPALPTIVVASTLSIAGAIMTESALSFLGLGIKQPMSSWGTMLQNAQNSIGSAPYMSIFPGLLIVLTVFSLNKLGDILRVLIEPRQNAK